VADIILSYARADANLAKQMADALAAKGWKVWWDVSLVAGDHFRPKIAEQVSSAKCVVVLWSRHSIESDWVIDEAEDGKRRGVLVQALIEYVSPPYGFRQIQAALLTQWDGGDSGEFARLCAGISAYAPRSTSTKPASSTRAQPAPAPRPQTDAPATPSLEFPSGLPVSQRWLELERRFRRLEGSVMNANSEVFSPESWRISSGSESARSEFRMLAECAGELLQGSLHVWHEVKFTHGVVPIVNAVDDVDRWLRFLRGDRGGDVGAIMNVAKVSAEACAYCAAKEQRP